MTLRKLLLLLLFVLTLAGCAAPASAGTPLPPGNTAAPGSSPAITPTPPGTATAFPTATDTLAPPALPPLASPTLSRVDFKDTDNGWAIAVNDSGYVTRTVNGGTTWWNATPAGAGPIGYSANLFALDTNTAWLLVPGKDFFSGMLYHTRDGGLNWSSNPVPFGSALLQFPDASTGRALVDRWGRGGAEAVELFQTSDGGASWTSVFHDDPSQPGSSDSLPLAGIKSGLTFINANTGWVTGSIPVDGDTYLYITQDSGVSWQQQSLPLPAGYASYRYLLQAPVFFGSDGLLPVTIYLPDAAVLTVYTSQDGGVTWSGDPTDTARVISPSGLPAFADANHGYVWDGGSSIHQSIDGTQKWTAVTTNLDLSGNLAQLDFVASPGIQPVGWALTRSDETGHSRLYHTTDGLQWTPLIP